MRRYRGQGLLSTGKFALDHIHEIKENMQEGGEMQVDGEMVPYTTTEYIVAPPEERHRLQNIQIMKVLYMLVEKEPFASVETANCDLGLSVDEEDKDTSTADYLSTRLHLLGHVIYDHVLGPDYRGHSEDEIELGTIIFSIMVLRKWLLIGRMDTTNVFLTIQVLLNKDEDGFSVNIENATAVGSRLFCEFNLLTRDYFPST